MTGPTQALEELVKRMAMTGAGSPQNWSKELAALLPDLKARLAFACNAHGHLNTLREYEGTEFYRCEVCGLNQDEQENEDG